MTPRPLAILPDPILRATAAPVPGMSDSLSRLMADMAATMAAHGGVGLAAPQIGVKARVIVMQCNERDYGDYAPDNALVYHYRPEFADSPPPKLWKMANPRVIDQSAETISWEEGCLSIPDVRGEVTRPHWVRVRYLAETGQEEDMEAEGVLAICVQHEIDHLDGRLFIDYLSPARRDLITRKFTKQARNRHPKPSLQPQV